MMSDGRRSRGIRLPSFGQCLTPALALGAGWWLWSAHSAQHEIVNLSRPSVDPVTYLQAVESVVNRGRDGVPELLAALSSDSPKARVYALYALGRIGPAEGDVIAPVCARLNDENAGVRESAVSALRHLTSERAAVAPVIAGMLDDGDGNVRSAVARELIDLGPAAVPSIVVLLRSDRSTLRSRAVRILRNPRLVDKSKALTEIGSVVRALIDDSDPEVRGEALMALVDWQLADASETRRLLLSRRSENIEVALKGVVQMEGGARIFLPDLILLLDDPELESAAEPPAGTQTWLRPLLELLSSIRTEARPAAARLLRLFDVRRDHDRIFIARTLVAIGADREEMIHAFESLLRDADFRLAREAGWLLVQISPDAARRNVAELVRELPGVAHSIAPSIINAIGNLGPQAGGAVPALVPLLNSSDRTIAESAAGTLAEIGADAARAVSDLTALMHRNSLTFSHRTKIARALGNIGPLAREALPVLLEILDQPEPPEPRAMFPARRDDDVQFRAAVVAAVGKIADDSPRNVAALRSQIASRSPIVQVAAFESLVRIAPDSMAVFEELQRALANDDDDLRIYAALAIGQSTGDRDRVVAALAKTLADEHPRVRTAAAVALGRIGPAARAALPALHGAMNDDTNPDTLPRAPTLSAMMRRAPPPPPELRQVSCRQAVLAAVSKIDPPSDESADRRH